VGRTESVLLTGKRLVMYFRVTLGKLIAVVFVVLGLTLIGFICVTQASDRFSLTDHYDGEYNGVLTVESTSVNVDTYYTDISGAGESAQAIVDADNSAALFKYDQYSVYSDHNDQGFSELYNVDVGDLAALMLEEDNPDSIAAVYECVRTCVGYNNGDLMDENYTEIGYLADGTILMYTCIGSAGMIFMTFWKAVSDLGSALVDRWCENSTLIGIADSDRTAVTDRETVQNLVDCINVSVGNEVLTLDESTEEWLYKVVDECRNGAEEYSIPEDVKTKLNECALSIFDKSDEEQLNDTTYKVVSSVLGAYGDKSSVLADKNNVVDQVYQGLIDAGVDSAQAKSISKATVKSDNLDAWFGTSVSYGWRHSGFIASLVSNGVLTANSTWSTCCI
jgi:hypothetical protein